MKLTTSLKGLLFFVLMLGTGSRTSAGPIYDAAGDFSIASNPNGVWSYGTTGTTLTGPLTLFTSTKSGIGGIPDLSGWEGNQSMFGDNFPLIGKNTSSMTEMSSGVVVLPGQLVMNPAPDGSYAVVRFTAPTSGSFLLNTAFEGRESVSPGSTADVHVLLNGVALFNGAVAGYGNGVPFATTLNLRMGDLVDFSVGYGASKSFLGDITSLSATISPASVPEPSGFLLLFSGLCCSGLLAWQRGPRQP